MCCEQRKVSYTVRTGVHLPCTKDSGCGCGLRVTALSMLEDGCGAVTLITEVKVHPGWGWGDGFMGTEVHMLTKCSYLSNQIVFH